MALPALEGAILGILRREPLSGYDLRKLFLATPLGSYSDSPGSIYPALRRMEQRGLLRGRDEPGSTVRRRLYAVTAKGERHFRAWVSEPPTQVRVQKWFDGELLRFAFADAVLTRAELLSWMRELNAHIEAELAGLRAFRRQVAGEYDLCGLLGLDAGIAHMRAMRVWSRAALARIGAGI